MKEDKKENRSPRITHVSWGRIDVEGVGTGHDFKLYPGGGRAWDWAETGTHHKPGIQPADVQELLDHGSKVVILSRGSSWLCGHARRLCICCAAKALLTTSRRPARP